MESDPPPTALSAVRTLTWVLLALLVVVTTTSAWVRLAQAGLSCAGAPDCYATKSARVAADRATSTAIARTAHRVAASAAGAVILAMLFFGWRAGGAAVRAAIVLLALLAVGLATLGRHTPSSVPAVTLGNLVGGMSMVGIAAWLASRLRRRAGSPEGGTFGPWVMLAIVLVVLQVATGAMISAHHAALACEAPFACAGGIWPSGAGVGAFDPWRELPPPVDAASRADVARQAVLAAHHALALAALLALLGLAARCARAGMRGPARALVVLSAVQAGLGLGQAALGHPLALAVAHNVGAATVVFTLGVLLERAGAERPD